MWRQKTPPPPRLTELTSSRAGCQPSSLACPHAAAPNSDHTPWGEERGTRGKCSHRLHLTHLTLRTWPSFLVRACPGNPSFLGVCLDPTTVVRRAQRGSQRVEGTCRVPGPRACSHARALAAAWEGTPLPRLSGSPLCHLQLGCGVFNSGHVVPTPARPQTQFGVKALLISQSGSHLL